MGCDGGTIPRRDELVRLKKKPEQKDKDSELVFKWRYCALTQQPLQVPIVGCGLGHLYSKEAVIEALLSKTLPPCASHIKNLKDIKELVLTKNAAFKPNAEKVEGQIDNRAAPYICPMIGLEMTGKFRFVFLWNCGCVFSERALKEIKTNVCVMCQKPFTENDIVVLNCSKEEEELMQTKIILRKSKNKKTKKSEETSTSENKSAISPENISILKTAPLIEETVNRPSTSSDVKTVSENKHSQIEVSNIKRSANMKRTANIKAINDPVFKKAKETYSVAKDSKASEVYKSLFTSHKADQEQNRAHWITYNPFYN